MRSSSGTRVHLHHCQPGFVRFVHSMRLRRVSRMSLRSPAGGLLPWSLFCFRHWAFLCPHLPQHPHSPAKEESPVHVFPFGSLLSFLPLLPFPFMPFTCSISIGTDVSGSCAAQGHHRFSVPASTLARKHARLGKTHDLQREQFSGNHGRLLARVPSQSLLGPPAGGPHMLQVCTAQRFSLRKQACHQGRVPRCISSLIWSAGQGYLSRALLCDFHHCPRTLP